MEAPDKVPCYCCEALCTNWDKAYPGKGWISYCKGCRIKFYDKKYPGQDHGYIQVMDDAAYTTEKHYLDAVKADVQAAKKIATSMTTCYCCGKECEVPIDHFGSSKPDQIANLCSDCDGAAAQASGNWSPSGRSKTWFKTSGDVDRLKAKLEADKIAQTKANAALKVNQVPCYCCQTPCTNRGYSSRVVNVCDTCDDLISDLISQPRNRFGFWDMQNHAGNLNEVKAQVAKAKAMPEEEKSFKCYCCGDVCKKPDLYSASDFLHTLCPKCDEVVAKKCGITPAKTSRKWNKAHKEVDTHKAELEKSKLSSSVLSNTKEQINCYCCNKLCDIPPLYKGDEKTNHALCATCDEIMTPRTGVSKQEQPASRTWGNWADNKLNAYKEELLQKKADDKLTATCYCCDAPCQDMVLKEGHEGQDSFVNVCAACSKEGAIKVGDDNESFYRRGKDNSWSISTWRKILDGIKTEKNAPKAPSPYPKTTCHCCGKTCNDIVLKGSYSNICVNVCASCDELLCAEINLDKLEPAKKDTVWDKEEFGKEIRAVQKALKNQSKPQKKGTKKMPPYDSDGNEISTMDMFKADAATAAYRVAANQLTKGVKSALVMALQNKGADGSKVDALREALDTPLGESLISVLMGYGIHYVPGIKNDPRAQLLSNEFRVNGLAGAGNEAMDLVMKHLVPAITDSMKNLPELPPITEMVGLKKPAKKRVSLETKTTAPAEPIEVPATIPEPSKKASTTGNTTSSV